MTAGGRSSTLNASTITLTVTPECFYHPLSVTPAIFKPGSTALKAFGFPIKDFGNDERGRSSPLNGSIRGPQSLKNMDASLNFRHDKKRSLGVRGTV